MFRTFKSIVTLITLAMCFSFSALAQETTGTIEGTITDANKAVVPGIEVTIATGRRTEGAASDSTVGFRRTVTTDGNGFFRVQQIPPGFYTVTTTASSGFGVATASNIEVQLGNTTPVNVALAAGGASVNVDVTADSLAIDPTGSKIQTSITQRTAELLPKGVNFTSLLTVAPAVRNEPLSGGFQIDGASGSENTFIIDGQEVSNFRTGTLNLNNNIPFQFVQEVQVKSSGFEAEFGGATGGVINVVTRGGGNDFRGEIGTDFRIAALQGSPRDFLNLTTFGGGAAPNPTAQTRVEFIRTPKDEGTSTFPFVSLGGPIIKDKAWFFGSYAPQLINVDRTIGLFTDNNSATTGDNDPATRRFNFVDTYTIRQKNEYAFGRIDLQPFESLRLTGTYLWNPIEVIGTPPAQNPFGTRPGITFPGRGLVTGPDFSDNVGGRQTSNNTTGTIVWTPTSKLVITGRGGYSFLNEKLGNYGVPPVSGQRRFLTQVCQTGSTPPVGGGFQACGTQNFPGFRQLLFDRSIRRTYDADASYLLSDFFGRHQFKGGGQLNSVSNAIQSQLVDTFVFRFGPGFTVRSLSGRDEAPAPTPGALGAGFLQRFATSGSAGSDNLAFYIQDSYQPIKRLTLNFGVRTERENSPSFNALGDGITFDFKDKIAPRLGVAYDLFGDGKTKIFGSYGRFFDRFKYELPRGSFGGDFFRLDYFEILPGQTQDSFSLQTVIGTNPDRIGGQCPINNFPAARSRCQIDARVPSNLPGQPEFGEVDPDIKAFRQSEYTVGAEHALGANFLVRGRYTHKQVDVAVEDIGIPIPGGEAYIIGNPGFGLAAQSAQANGFESLKAERKYDAFEIGLDRRFVNNYYFNANYTLSRLYGNYAGLASSDEGGRTSPNVNRNFDLPFIGYQGAGGPDNGRLPTDRPHVFKAYGAYEIPFSKSNSTEISGFTTIQSGTPLTTRYTIFGVAGQILNERGDLGRTEVFTQTDLGVRHRYRFGRDNRFTISATLDILNLFDEENVLGRVETISGVGVTGANIGLTGTSIQQEGAYQRRSSNTQALAFLNAPGTNRLSPTFNLPNFFQGPRNVRFGFRLQF